MNPMLARELEELPNEHDRFEIKDIHSLNWALRKLAAIKAKRDEVNELADAEIARIEAYRKHEMDKLQGSEDFFKQLIADYAARRRAEDPKFKSEVTPYGRIGYRKQQPKWHYNDDDLVRYLNENELFDFIRVKEEPNKVEIKKAFKVTDEGRVFDPDGNEVECIKVEFLPETLEVKVE